MLTRTRRKAYSILWWIGFLTFCLLPLAALTMGLGRLYFARADVQKAADAASLAAAAEVDIPYYRSTGQIRLLPSASGVASRYAALNTDYLARYEIQPYVTGIDVDQASHTVQVRVAANVSSLFPKVLGDITVSGAGMAEARLQSR